MSGFLVWWCNGCEHYHGRLLRKCTNPRCDCDWKPSDQRWPEDPR